ncbi:MAG TPA: PhoU domain-containing protein [Polyangiaceae bacterium]
MSRSVRPSPPALARLLPLADRVEALTRTSGRAFVARDARLAESLLAQGGEHERLDSALDAEWSELLGRGLPNDVPASVELVTSLQTITGLAASICTQVVGLSERGPVAHPAIQRLAELVPDLLRDALGAFRQNDRTTAERVLRSSVSVDVCFAQTYLDLLHVAREGTDHVETAQRLHAITRALERIGDGASEIADSVRALPP